MKRNTDRILVSHAGNLPRPADLDRLIAARDEQAFQKRIPGAVREIVDEQIAAGIDMVNDGEYVKAGSYTGYIYDRVSGFTTRPFDPQKPLKRGGIAARDRLEFPGFYASGLWLMGSGGPVRPGFATPGQLPPLSQGGVTRVCVGPLRYTGQEAVKRDTANLTAAIAGKGVQGFIAALGPLSIGAQHYNEHYATEDEYLIACAEVAREEYRAITAAGLIVQIDEPEFLTTWQFYPEWSVADLRRYLERAVEIINHALAGVPEDQVRFHSCWGSGHRPHTGDIELRHVADLLLKVKASAYSVEAANARHSHEWTVWKDVKIPAGTILMPGVISHATDVVEHPELIAERLVTYAGIVGKDCVQPSTDCGMGSRVGHQEVAWAKLRAMAEGARLASTRLWRS